MELINAVRASRSYLLKTIGDLSPKEIIQPATIGKWSVKDVLSHIAGWDIWVSTTIQTILGGNQPDLSAPLDVDVTNAKFVEERVRWSIDQILTEMADTLQKVLHIVGELSEEQIFKPQLFEGHDHSINHLLTVTYEHDRCHADKILLWRKSQKTGKIQVNPSGLAPHTDCGF